MTQSTAAAPPSPPCPAQTLGAVTLGAFLGTGKGNGRSRALSGIAASSPVLPAAHSPARPLPPPTKHFSFPCGALCNWNGTRETVLLFKSRSLNSHIYLEPHTPNLNLLGTVEMLTRAVPNPWLALNCRQRGFVPRVSRQSRRAHPPVSALHQEHEDSQA